MSKLNLFKGIVHPHDFLNLCVFLSFYIAYICMAQKTDISETIFLLKQHKHEIINVSQATPPPTHTHTHTLCV